MDSVVIKDLVKTYGTTEAVREISFSIHKGEIFGFLGPNGAGKTTTLSCICQLATKTTGTIVVEGHDIDKDYRDAKRRIGLSPQEPSFDLYFSVIDTLVAQGGYFGMRQKDAQARALQLLTQFGLLEKKDALFRELSGGMKRKVSIIKALMHNPSVLILDEPTAGIDVDSRYELWELIRQLNKDGMTIILTTHYIEEAHRLCDRIGIIAKGSLIKLDKTKTIVDELSRNVIRFYLETDKRPLALEGFEHTHRDGQLEIYVAKKEQADVLKKVLHIFEKEKVPYANFAVEEDTLENIFRRLVREH
ncbi:MAG: ABC transporter ATP-binding protein [Nanoarchaeota archaeon]